MDPILERALAALRELNEPGPALPEPDQPRNAPGPATAAGGAKACPYPLPEGVRLLKYQPRQPPIDITTCSVTLNPAAFIRRALAELDARLRSPVQIRAGDSVFELLQKLSACGLELRLEWPPQPSRKDTA
jgi:hypothetical protein